MIASIPTLMKLKSVFLPFLCSLC